MFCLLSAVVAYDSAAGAIAAEQRIFVAARIRGGIANSIAIPFRSFFQMTVLHSFVDLSICGQWHRGKA